MLPELTKRKKKKKKAQGHTHYIVEYSFPKGNDQTDILLSNSASLLNREIVRK